MLLYLSGNPWQILSVILDTPLLLLGSIVLLQTRIMPAIRDRLSRPSETKREIQEFVFSYRSHPAYWLSSFTGSIFAVISGITNDGIFGFLAVCAFIIPAAGFYWFNSPFGLRCSYIPIGGDEEEGGHACRPIGGTYTIQIEMIPGDNVSEYRLDVHTPSGAELDRLDGNTSHMDENRQILYGVVQEDLESYNEALYFEKTGSISPEGELVLIKSQGEGHTMEWIRLLPPV